MSITGGHRWETRAKIKDDQKWRAAVNLLIANEETPGWAQRLLLEVTDPNDSFERRFDELSNLMKDLKKKKETWAILSRVTNAEKRIGDLEDQCAADSKVLKELTNENLWNLQSLLTWKRIVGGTI